MKEFFDTDTGEESDDSTLSLLGKHEASFYKGDGQSVHFRACVRDIKQLKQMFSLIFFPDSRERLENQLKSIDNDMKLEFKMLNSLKVFQQCVLQLDTPTKVQKEALTEILKLRRVLIDGLAGTGKTYIVVHHILRLLSADINDKEGSEGLILLCLDTEPLGNEVVKWLCVRLVGEKNKKLERIHFMYRSGDNTKRHQVAIIDELELCQVPLDDDGRKYNYDLIVVDEGHHVFRNESEKKRGCCLFPRQGSVGSK